MKPIYFKEHTVVLAKYQKQYVDLPAWKGEDGEVICLMKCTFLERIRILLTGKIWYRQLTFNNTFQPIILQLEYPFVKKIK